MGKAHIISRECAYINGLLQQFAGTGGPIASPVCIMWGCITAWLHPLGSTSMATGKLSRSTEMGGTWARHRRGKSEL
jgi:hypothetical protein